MSHQEAEKAMKQAERALERIRLSIASAKAVAAAHQASLTELVARREAETRKAALAGKLPALADINHAMSDAERKLSEAQGVLSTLESEEQAAVHALVAAEKQAQNALVDLWNLEADKALQELIDVAGPALKRLYLARYHGSSPCPMAMLTRTAAGVVADIEGKASEAEVTFDLPETIYSSVLTDAERNQNTYHPALAFG